MAKQYTEWKQTSPNERMRVEYGLVHLKGNAEPYISVTATVEETRRGRWVEVGGGAMHKEIVKYWPEFEELVAWHLVSPSAPMHYLANGQYWWEHILGTNKYDLRSYDADPVEAFKNTILYGALPGDEALVLPEPAGRGVRPTERPTLDEEPAPKDIRPWLEDRLAGLQQRFKEVVEKYDLVVTQKNPGMQKLKTKLLR